MGNLVHNHFNFSSELEAGQEPIEQGDLLTIGSKEYHFDGFPEASKGDYSIIQVSTPPKGNRKGKLFELETSDLEGFVAPDTEETTPKKRKSKKAVKEAAPEPSNENDYSNLIAEGQEFESTKELVQFVCSLPENEELKNSEIQKKYGMPNSVTISQVRKAMKGGGTSKPKAKKSSKAKAAKEPEAQAKEAPANEFEGLINTSTLDNAKKGQEELANTLLDACDFIELLNAQFNCLNAKGKKMVEKWAKLGEANLPEG